jgi:hypothetical protein
VVSLTHGQQTIFNVPTTDVLDKGKVYAELDASLNHNDVVTVLLPEFIPAKWWQHLLHNQSSLMLKGALLFKEGVIVFSVPYHLKR